jgi:hypothetical protein
MTSIADSRNPRRDKHFSPRRLFRLGFVLAAVVAFLALVFSFAPSYIARYFIASELDARGIESEGIETLEINPWTRELWLGPARFGAGASSRGTLGALNLTLHVAPLFERRISIERLSLREVDVTVTRSGDDLLSLNGIPLAPPVGAADAPVKDGDVWTVGADAVEVRDSRLIFQNGDRGELATDLERLALTGFKAWEPELPGRFELAARVNDIQLYWSGEATPFAENITLVIDSRIEGMDIPKMVRFSGPLGLDRREGTYHAQLRHTLSLPGSGGVEGHTSGNIEIDGVDYARSGVFELSLEKATVQLDMSYALTNSGNRVLKGAVALDLGPNRTAVAEKTRFAAAAGRVSVNELDVKFTKDVGLEITGTSAVDIEGMEFSGPIEISVDKLLDLVVLLQSLSTTQAVTLADTGLGDFSGRSLLVPSSDVTTDRLSAEFGAFKLESTEGRLELALMASAELVKTDIAAKQRRIAFGNWQSGLEQLSVASGQGRLALELRGNSSIAEGAASGPRGESKVKALSAQVDQFDLRAEPGNVSLQLAAAGRAKGFSGLAYAKQALPEFQVGVGAAHAVVTKASIDSQSGSLRWQASGDATAESVTASIANGEGGSLALDRVEIRALQAEEPSRFAADALIIKDMDLKLKRSPAVAVFSRFGAASRKATGAATLGGPKRGAEATSASGNTSKRIDVRRVQTLLTDLGYEPGPADGLMGRRTAAAIRGFQRQEGLSVDGRLSSNLVAALQLKAAGPDDSDVASIPQGASTSAPTGAAGLSVRLGRLALTGIPVVRFRDELITPNVEIDSVIRKLQIENLDTENTDQRTQLTLIAQLDERTDVELAGWVSGSMKNADLDVTAEVANLHLPTYSPYFAEFSGLHLKSGRLDATTKVQAAQGNLQGEIQLSLADSGFRPSSKADTQGITEKEGMPLETAIDLLKDADGRIALSLPITGRVSNPDVDFRPAINKAIGNVLQMIFPPTLIASMLASLADSSSPAFVSIEFSPGSAELNQAGKSAADSLARLLSERPELSLTLCGRLTAQDRSAVTSAGKTYSRQDANAGGLFGESSASPVLDQAEAKQAFTELAAERMRAVRRHLTDRKGIDAARISECRPTVEAADQGRPRVDVSL